MNGCNISVAKSRVEDCLELNFKYTNYQTLAHLSCSSYVCWTSGHTTRAQRFSSVRASISPSTVIRNESFCACMQTITFAFFFFCTHSLLPPTHTNVSWPPTKQRLSPCFSLLTTSWNGSFQTWRGHIRPLLDSILETELPRSLSPRLGQIVC